MKFSRTLLRDALLCSSALIACASFSSASASGSLDTTGIWDGSNYIDAWGSNATPTYGESFTTTSQTTHISSSTFYTSANGSADTVAYQAYVYGYNGNGITGAALYTSPVMTLNVPADGSFVPARVALDAQLAPNTRYVVFYTTENVPQTSYGSALNWGMLPNSIDNGGHFVYTNGEAFSPFWDGANGFPDTLAMQLQFADVLRWNAAGSSGSASGGTGVWNGTATNWKTANQASTSAWNGGAAVFGGTAGQITTNGSIGFQQLQFFTSGYSIAAAAGSNLVPNGIATIEPIAGVTTSISAPIVGSGGLVKQGQGTLVLSGANTYSGGTTLSQGTLQAGIDTVGAPGAIVSSAIGTGTLTFDSGALQAGGNFTIANTGLINSSGGTLDANGNVFTYSGTLGDGNGSGALSITDVAGLGGTVVLSGANTYSGGTTLSGGLLRAGVDTVGTPYAISSSAIGTGALTFDGGTLQAGGNFTIANTGYVNPTNGIIDSNGNTFTYAGTISDSGLGSGGLVITDSTGLGGTVVLSSSNNYSGGTTLSGGQLRIGIDTDGAPGSINTSAIGLGPLTFDGGTLQAGGNFTIANDALVNATGGTIDANGFNFTYSGAITDGNLSASQTVGINNGGIPILSRAPGLTIADAAGLNGTVILSGANTYSGGTTLSGGKLLVGIDTDGSPGAINSSAIGVGTLTFNGGTLQAGGNFTIANDGAANMIGGTIDANGYAFTYSGAIADGDGPGNLTIVNSAASPGSVTFTGANTYTGVTSIAAGATLALTGTGSIASSSGLADAGTFDVSGASAGVSIATLSGAGSVALGSNTLTVTQGSTAFSGAIGGSGGLTVSGGTQVLAGANTYTGATTIGSGATLALAGGGSILNSSGVIDNGSLSIAGNGTTVLKSLSGAGGAVLGSNTLVVSSGTFTGTLGANGDTGSLVKTGSGTFTFAGGNYSGLTGVAAGTLIQTGATGNAANVAIASGGTLQTNAANVFATNAVVNDNGLLVLNNYNQTIGSLTGNGIVQLGSGTLTYTSSSNSFAGTMSGSGGFTKTGTSTFTMSGSNTYSGDTNVNAGILNVVGTLTGSRVIVNNGGTLAGSGTLADPTINAGGTLAPGAVTGVPTTLTVGGPTDPLVFMPNSFYTVIVTPTASDRTIAQGATIINGGTVNVFAGGGTYLPQSRYNIISSAGGVTGAFSGVESNFAFLRPTLAYDANDVTLVLSRNDMSFASVATTSNQRNVANGLTAASRATQSVGGGAVLNAVASLSAQQAQTALTSMSGEGIAAAQNTAYRSSSLFVSTITDQTTFFGSNAANSITLNDTAPAVRAYAPLGAAGPIVTHDAIVPLQRKWRAYATGFGAGEAVHGDASIGTATQNNSVYGGLVGVDYQVTPDTLVGVALGGTNGGFSVPNRATYGSTTGGHAAVYTLANFGAFYGAGTTSFSYFGNKTTRTVAGFAGLAGETEHGTFASHEFRSRAEFGRHFDAYGATLTPFMALEIAELRSNGFAETTMSGPGLLALDVSGKDGASVPGYVGARVARPVVLGNGMIFSPTLQAAYLHEFSPQRTLTGTFVSLPGSSFLVDGARAARNAAQTKAGAELALNDRLRVFANFEGEFSGVEQVYAGKGGLQYNW